MDIQKSQAVKECKKLLRLINCEAIVDTKEQTLCDVLFQSEAKKKMLLSWLIQQIYSSDTCANNTFEDLISLFIPKRNLNNFLTGNLSTTEQYKLWKLLLTSVHRMQKRLVDRENNCIVGNVQSGTVLLKYEELWSKKFEPNTKFIGLVGGKHREPNISELKSELEKSKDEIATRSALLEPKLSYNVNSPSTDNEPSITGKMRESNEKLDEIMKSVVALVPVNTSSKDVDMKYSCLDEGTVKEITSSLRALLENIDTMNQLIHEVKDN